MSDVTGAVDSVAVDAVAVVNAAADESVGKRDMDRTHGSAVRSGMAWTLGGQWAAYAVQIVTTAVLARLVSPKDFGLLGEALTVTAFATQLQTLGLSQAVIQRAKLTHGQMSNLFWVNVAAGGVLMVLVSAAAPLVAMFYGNSALVGVTAAMSVTFLIAGFAVQHGALMARRMKFRAIALRSLTPKIIGGAVAIAAAAAFNAGYWALVIQQLVAMLCTTIFVWTAIDWRPSRPSRGTGVRPLLRFGAGVSVANLFYYFSSNADNILVGRFLGTVPLGLYARAYNLFLVPLRQIHGPMGNVVQPVMSAIISEPRRYRQFYRRTLSGITVVGMPAVVFLAVASRPIIHVVLGARWLGAADAFRWLAVAGFLQMIGRTFSWLFTTSGRSRAMAIWAMITSPLTVGAFVVGLHWGIAGVAASYAVIQVIFILPGIWWAVRGTPVTLGDVGSSVWRPVVVAAAVGAASLLGRQLAGGGSALTVLLVSAVAAGICYGAMVFGWPEVRRELVAIRGTIGRRNAAG
jgi:O-antigen/teichoic acid export membrane protein